MLRWLPASSAGRTLALVAFIDSIGTGLFLAGSTIFFVRAAELSVAEVGHALAIATSVGLLAMLPIGLVTERLGAWRALVALQLWRAVWFAVLAFVHGMVAVTVVYALLAVAERSISPATQVVVSMAVGDRDRVTTMAMIRSVRNAGFSVGALLAVPLLALHSDFAYRTIIIADAASFVIAAMLLLRLRLNDEPTTRKRSPLEFMFGFRDWRYLALAANNTVLRLHMTMLSVAIPLWTIKATRAPDIMVPVLLALNTVMAVAFQVPFSRRVNSVDGGRKALARSGTVLAMCCVPMAAAAQLPPWPAAMMLALATVLLTAGEMWQSAAGWELSYHFAPADRQVQYLSVFSLSTAAQEIGGPLLLTIVVIGHDTTGWILLAAIFLIASLATRPVIRALDSASPAAVTPTTTSNPDTHEGSS